VSRWTHAICQDCWDEQSPDRPAVRAVLGEDELCCWCSEETSSGIYLRANPASLDCEGFHRGDES
jgi:hypothetical protein